MATQESETSIRDFVIKLKYWLLFLKSRWLVIGVAIFIGGATKFLLARYEKTLYKAVLSFVVEEERSGGGFSGFASQFGFDGGGGGNAFTGNNLFAFMKSRMVIEKTLLDPVIVNGKEISLADLFIDFKGYRKSDKSSLKNLHFKPHADQNSFSVDEIVGLRSIYEEIVDKNLFVGQNDKKVSIMTIEMLTENEQFSKVFTESLAKEISDFYIETKSKKAKMNVRIMERQVDSIRGELNSAISGAAYAQDNVYNLNPALNIKRVPSTRKQVDIQTNTAILNQLLPSLEQAKVTLRKETPLIQVLETPIIPLNRVQPDQKQAFLTGGFIAGLLTVVALVIGRWIRTKLTTLPR